MKTRSITIAALLLASTGLPAGDTVTLTFNQKGSWVMSNPLDDSSARLQFPDAEPLVVNLSLRDPAKARRALADLRPAILASPFMPRSGATPEDRAAALQLARAVLAELPTGERSHEFIWKQEAVVRCLERILMVAGTADDARALVDYCGKEHKYPNNLAGKYMAIAAYIEARLGTLGSGALQAALKSAVPAVRSHAAILLRAWGSPAGDKILLAAARDPKKAQCSLEHVFAVMADCGDPALVKIARAQFAEAVKRWQDARPHIAAGEPHYYDSLYLFRGLLPYLLVHGTAEDRARLAGTPLPPRVVAELVPIVADPSALLPAITGVKGYMSSSAYFTECASALRTHDDLMRKRVLRRMQTLVYRQYLQAAPDSVPADRKSLWAQIFMKKRFPPMLSFMTPPSDLGFYWDADFYDPATSSICWAPAAGGYHPAVVNHFLKNESFKMGRSWYAGDRESSLRKLDHLPFADLQSLVQASDAGDLSKALLLAAHKVSQGAFLAPKDRYQGESLHRPYWIPVPNNGTVAGILSVSPELRDGTLKVSYSLDQSVHIYRTMIDAEPDSAFPISRYRADHGKHTFKSVRLVQDGKSSPISIDGPDEDGRFSGTIPLSTTAGAYLVFDLAILGRSGEIAIDLFATSDARKRRR